ncbi:hypothetical protein [Legionella maceachernii]|uniref:Glycosyltransferase RgtA/B/C/D-like domain-containing protein n=1 Tax=Legionella maceachernii TaxID=466 RepID=A0A0W0W6G4_9GAMM|nr:hypothetical protein [Legionella maceachernii]KTD27963.1 hypothetical protein Lmac_1022 [Legionella maceachernii]SKA26092.1 hypothetical protein SAMN02745128_02877 [Legionella maceachernii]SUO99961.1 Uncharacterised protein [Legionella maceachernii]
MSYLSVIIELWILLLLCTLVGRRAADLLPKVTHNSIGFYVAPILGLSCLLLMAILYGWLTAFRLRYTLVSVFALLVFSIFYEKNPRQLVKEWVQVCVFATVCSLPILMPIIHYQGFNPFTDAFTYLAHGQWLQGHAFSEKPFASGYYPYLSQIELYQNSRMGASFFLAYVQSLFALKWSYYAYTPTVSLAFVTGCLAIGGLIRQVISAKRFFILALAAIPCFSMNGFLFGAEWGFFPQTFGLAFAAGFAALFPQLIRFVISEDKVWPKIIVYALPASLTTAAMLFAYNEPFPIFSIALCLFVLIVCLKHKKKIKNTLLFFSIYLLQVCILLNYEGIRIAKNLLQTLSLTKEPNFGWPVLWSPIQFLAHAFGMKSSFSDDPYYLDYLSSHYLFPILLVGLLVLLFRFMRIKSKRNLAIIFLLCVDFVLLLFFIKFRYFSASSTEIGYTFLQYKLSKYAAPFSLALIGIGFAILWQKKKKLRPLFAVTYMSLIAAGFFYQDYFVSQNLTQNFIDETKQDRNPFQSLLKLRSAVSTIPKDKIAYVALGQAHNKLRQMVAYVLYDRKIASDYRDDGYILGNLPEDERALQPHKEDWLITISSRNTSCEPKPLEVEPFAIYPPLSSYMMLAKNEGGYGTEFNAQGETWNWVSNSISYIYSVIGAANEAKFSFKLSSFPHPRSVVVELKNVSGDLLGKYELEKKEGDILFETPWVKINSEQIVLHAKADGKPVRISSNDPREASFVIANVKACTR